MDKKNIELCDETAKLIIQNNSLNLLRNIAALDTNSSFDNEIIQTLSSPNTISTIGVWSKQVNGDWQRNENYFNEWKCWSDIPVIKKKEKGKKRVVLIGESVARGYIFDPVITPTKLVDYLLKYKIKNLNYDVIDLARIDITAVQMIDLIKKIPAINPDYVCFFAGNNWLKLDNMSLANMQNIAAILKYNSFSEAQSYFKENCLRKNIDILMMLLNQLKEKGIKIIIVIPAFNLRDWRTDINQPEYAGIMDDISSSSDEKQFTPMQKLEIHGDEMLSRASYNEAKLSLVQARDFVEGVPIKFTPRCTDYIQNCIKNNAEKFKMVVIDLPDLLSKEAQSGIPGLDFFIDYCHLNIKGLTFVANKIVDVITDNVETKLSESDIQRLATNKDLSASYFIAALHNAHYGQPLKTIDYLLSTAIQIDCSIIKIMRLYVLSYANSDVPIWMTNEFYEFSQYSSVIRRYLLPMEAKKNIRLADTLLKRAILAHIDDKNIINKSLSTKRHFQLTAPEYWAQSNAELLGFDLSHNKLYYIAKSNKSMFYVSLLDKVQVEIQLILSLPSKNYGTITLLLNNKKINTCELDETWKDIVFTLTLDKGENQFHILWPDPKSFICKESIANSLSLGKMPQMFPDYGNIFDFSFSIKEKKYIRKKIIFEKSLAQN